MKTQWLLIAALAAGMTLGGQPVLADQALAPKNKLPSLKDLMPSEKLTDSLRPSPQVPTTNPLLQSVFPIPQLPDSFEFEKPSNEGGWGSSGGGIGVGCFANADVAQRLGRPDEILNRLSPEQLNELKSLVTLEFWESSTQGFELPPKGRAMKAYLADARRFITEISPMLSLRLAQLAPLIQPGRWIPPGKNDPWVSTNDVRPRRALPATCRLIQIAVRYTDHADAKGNFPTRLPKVRVYFEPTLFARLDPLNRAMLILHEELYLLAKSIGHEDSDGIRPMVVFFFSTEMPTRPWTARTRRVIQAQAIETLGDYFMYFHEESLSVSRKDAPANSAYSRYYSFQSYLLRLREDFGKCQDRSGPQSSHCADEVHAPERLTRLLTNEEMFVLMARGYLDEWTEDDRYDGSEFLTVPFTDATLTARGERSLGFACARMRQMLPEAQGARGEGMLRKAVAYCDGLNAPSSSP